MKKDIFNFNNQSNDNDNNDLLIEIANDLNELSIISTIIF